MSEKDRAMLGVRVAAVSLLHLERMSSFVGNRISFFLDAFPDLSAEVWANTSSSNTTILILFNLFCCALLFTDGWHYVICLKWRITNTQTRGKCLMHLLRFMLLQYFRRHLQYQSQLKRRIFNRFLSDPTENLLKESKSSSWTPINTGVQKGECCDELMTGTCSHFRAKCHCIFLFFYMLLCALFFLSFSYCIVVIFVTVASRFMIHYCYLLLFYSLLLMYGDLEWSETLLNKTYYYYYYYYYSKWFDCLFMI